MVHFETTIQEAEPFHTHPSPYAQSTADAEHFCRIMGLAGAKK